jgi:ABC-type glycerol-3-phosphate transport system permease component
VTTASQTLSEKPADKPQAGQTTQSRSWALSKIVTKTLIYLTLIILGITWIYTVPPVLIPSPAYWNNFADAWTRLDFNRAAFNSVFLYAIPVTFFTLVSSMLIAYGFARIRWRGREALFWLCIATMMLPWQVTMVPLFIIFKNLGWINTYWPFIVPSLFGNAYFVFLLRQFFLTIPEELSDAARIDGAGELGILWRIIVPLSKPAMAVVLLFCFLGAWNNYLGPLIYINTESLQPLALAIYRLRTLATSMGNTAMAYPHLMAVSTVVALPIVMLFIFAQRTFIEGISTTGLKG